jgi:membrane-bound metal-dependent hydrolase YbcI (DUF457 family)
MTTFEHAMVGINGALAAGLGKRYGWPLAAWAGVASILPDWDGLTILFGAHAYDKGHRIWGHNLLVAGLLGALIGYIAHRFGVLENMQRWLAGRWPVFAVSKTGDPSIMPVRQVSQGYTGLWVIVGVVAAYVHLLADIAFSVGNNLSVWGIPLGWPFTSRECAYPLIRWGDVGATLILIASMFAMVRNPTRTRRIAAGSLLLVVAYAFARGYLV